MSEMSAEAGSSVYFEQKLGDLDVRQRCRDLIDQILRGR